MSSSSKIMERWLKRKAPDSANNANCQQKTDNNAIISSPDINWGEEIQFDLGKRKEIRAYHPNLRDVVRRGTWKMDLVNLALLIFHGLGLKRDRRFNPE
jgi:hypothetical protein